MQLNFDLKLYEKNQVVIYAVQGEKNSRTVCFRIVEKSGNVQPTSNAAVTDQVLDLTDYTLTLYAKQPDGNIQSCAGTTVGTAANGQAYFTLPEEFMTLPGKSDCTVVLTKNSTDLRLVGITLDVQPSLSNANNPEDNIITLRRGRSLSRIVTAVTESGEPYVINTGDVVHFAVCDDRTDAVVIEKILEYDSESGGWKLKLDPADTINLSVGIYHYDIGLENADGDYDDIIEWNEFRVNKSASQAYTDTDSSQSGSGDEYIMIGPNS